MRSELRRKLTIWDLLANVLIVVSVVYSVSWYFTGGVDAMGGSGMRMLRYFTNLSNIFAAAASVVWIAVCARRLKYDASTPQWALTFRFMGAVSTTITLIVVIVFLAPTAMMKSGFFKGLFSMYEGNVLHLHLTAPVLNIVSVLIASDHRHLNLRQVCLSLIPLILYAAAYVLFVVVLKRWPDFYGFTFGGRMYMIPVSALGVFAIGYGSAVVLRALRGRVLAKLNGKQDLTK